jgi:hypothetical protein
VSSIVGLISASCAAALFKCKRRNWALLAVGDVG